MIKNVIAETQETIKDHTTEDHAPDQFLPVHDFLSIFKNKDYIPDVTGLIDVKERWSLPIYLNKDFEILR